MVVQIVEILPHGRQGVRESHEVNTVVADALVTQEATFLAGIVLSYFPELFRLWEGERGNNK